MATGFSPSSRLSAVAVPCTTLSLAMSRSGRPVESTRAFQSTVYLDFHSLLLPIPGLSSTTFTKACLKTGRRSNTLSQSPSLVGRIFDQRAYSQRIAVDVLLWRSQHPGRYQSRMQGIRRPTLGLAVSPTRGGRSCPPAGVDRWSARSAQRPTEASEQVGHKKTSSLVRRDSDLEAFSRKPADGSFAPVADRPSTRTKCPNLRFLSY